MHQVAFGFFVIIVDSHAYFQTLNQSHRVHQLNIDFANRNSMSLQINIHQQWKSTSNCFFFIVEN